MLSAVKKARELRQEIDDGKDLLDGRRKQEAATENTLKAICKEHVKRDGAKLRTVKWRARVLECLVYPELGRRQIDIIKRSEVIRLLDKIEHENGPVMADRTLACVRKVMSWWAVRDDTYNSPNVGGMTRTNGKERARERILSDDEIRVVWKVADAVDTPLIRLVRSSG